MDGSPDKDEVAGNPMEGARENQPESGLAGVVHAADGWLEKLYFSFVDWRQHVAANEPAIDLWQQVLQWYAAFDLSFTQLAQYLDDLTDVSDAQLALAQSSESVLSDGVRMLPLAHQRLRALPQELQDHLATVHLSRVAQEPLYDAERVSGMDDLYRIRAHACRVVYHLSSHGPLILAVTAEHWRHPSSKE